MFDQMEDTSASRDDFVELVFKSGRSPLGATADCRFWITCTQLDNMIASGGRIETQDLIDGLIGWLRVTDDPHPALDTLRLLFEARARRGIL